MMSAILLLCIMAGCTHNQTAGSNSGADADDTALSCKMTSPELQARKETVLADLKNNILERKELANGFAFKFKGDDQTIDQIIAFAKSERACCDFFTFNLEMTGDTNAVWLQITGPAKAKSFIQEELSL